MVSERALVEEFWPQHAELCTEHDWRLLSEAAEHNQVPTESTLEPHGEAKDAMLTSLMTVYWGLRIAHIALVIARETKDFRGTARVEAILDAVLKRVDEKTPQAVTKHIRALVESVASTN